MGIFSDIFGIKARRALREQKAADEAAQRAKVIKDRMDLIYPAVRPINTGPLTAQRAAEQERRKQDDLSRQRRAMVDAAARNDSPAPAPVQDALYPAYTSSGSYDTCSTSSADSGSSDSGSCGGSA